MTVPVSHPPNPGGGRILALDAARGGAIVAMISYHFMWDLYFTGFWEVNAAQDPWLRLYAKTIAATFLTISGISLALAHGRAVRWRRFLRRLAVIAAAALAVTVGSWFAFPQSFIFFGILHCIAAASVVALPFLRAPPWAVLAAAAFFFALPQFIASPALETWSTWWLGLGELPPVSNDYVPLFPWAGFVLAGVALARLLEPWRDAARQWRPRAVPGRALVFAGRHSLIIYLTHQIVLLGLLIGLAQILRA
ncbi:heparan-alpha-glucosaminide N-acetyltransferase [Pseudochelatococcus sp. B33]